MSSNSNHRYSRVLGHDQKDAQETKITSNRVAPNLKLIAICFFVGVAGFFIAQAGRKIVKGATSELERKSVISLVFKERWTSDPTQCERPNTHSSITAAFPTPHPTGRIDPGAPSSPSKAASLSTLPSRPLAPPSPSSTSSTVWYHHNAISPNDEMLITLCRTTCGELIGPIMTPPSLGKSSRMRTSTLISDRATCGTAQICCVKA